MSAMPEQPGKPRGQEPPEDKDTKSRDDSAGPDLSGQEGSQVEDQARPNAQVIHEVIRQEGEENLARSSAALAWSGLAAGLSMGFSLVSEGLLRSMLPDAPWRPLVSKLGYTIGFLFVIVGRQQLFTENTLTPILPLLTNRDAKTLWGVLRLWSIVLATNLIGAFVFAWVAGHTDIFTPNVRHAFRDIARDSLHGGFASHLLRGIIAGWLIALMVWMLASAEHSRFQIIIVVTYLVGLGGLAHIIAGSVESFYGVTMGLATWGTYWLGFMLPTLLGNILGGTVLVAALNYAQVAPGGTGGKGSSG